MSFTEQHQVTKWVIDFVAKYPVPFHHAGSFDGTGGLVMLAPRLSGEDQHALPPGYAAPAYPVALYAGCPQGWQHKAAVFIPIPRGKDGKGPGMWYDWRHCTGGFGWAIVPSTTGLNPITGQKTDKLRLERYAEKCPVHNVDFEPIRKCPLCGFAWPPQNYVAAPNPLWWDGFRRPDGTVHQFYFTDDVLRDVGIAALGKDRVPAFGFAFFRTKEALPQPSYYRNLPLLGSAVMGWNADDGPIASSSPAPFGTQKGAPQTLCSVEPPTGTRAPRGGSGQRANSARRNAISQTVAVGAGAQIAQDLVEDPRALDEYQSEPTCTMTVYFVPEEVAIEILEGPRRDTVGDKKGFVGKLGVEVG